MTSFSLGTSTNSHVWFFPKHSIYSSMDFSHTSFLGVSSKSGGTYILENNAKTKNEFIISTLYKSYKCVVFHGNNISNVRLEYLVLLGLLAGVCFTLGVLKRVSCDVEGGTIVCVVSCGAFLGVEGMEIWLICGILTTSSVMS